MARQKLGLVSIATMANGRISEAIDEELVKIGTDLVNRPGNKKARVMTLKISIVPVGGGGELDDVDPLAKVKFRISSNVPTRESADYTVAVSGNGRMVVNPDSPDDPRQGTLDEVVKKDA